MLVVNAKSLLKTNMRKVYWSPINSGFTKNQNVAYRDRDTFVRLGKEPKSVRGRKRTNVVEIAVEYAVHDLASHVVRVVEIGAGRKSEIIWLRDSSN